MELISAHTRRILRRNLAQLRAVFDAVHALYPTETDCVVCGGYDEYTDSGYDPSCAVCGGSGRVVSWTVWQFRARIAITNPERLAMFGVPPGAELGDTGLYVDSDGAAIIKKIMENNAAYLYIEGDRYRPSSMMAVGVGKADEYRAECNRFNPETRATGY